MILKNVNYRSIPVVFLNTGGNFPCGFKRLFISASQPENGIIIFLTSTFNPSSRICPFICGDDDAFQRTAVTDSRTSSYGVRRKR
jgi:hypothetical protein